MDPTQCLRDLREAVDRGDCETAAERFRDLDEWLSRGGFLPGQWASMREN